MAGPKKTKVSLTKAKGSSLAWVCQADTALRNEVLGQRKVLLENLLSLLRHKGKGKGRAIGARRTGCKQSDASAISLLVKLSILKALRRGTKKGSTASFKTKSKLHAPAQLPAGRSQALL